MKSTPSSAERPIARRDRVAGASIGRGLDARELEELLARTGVVGVELDRLLQEALVGDAALGARPGLERQEEALDLLAPGRIRADALGAPEARSARSRWSSACLRGVGEVAVGHLVGAFEVGRAGEHLVERRAHRFEIAAALRLLAALERVDDLGSAQPIELAEELARRALPAPVARGALADDVLVRVAELPVAGFAEAARPPGAPRRGAARVRCWRTRRRCARRRGRSCGRRRAERRRALGRRRSAPPAPARPGRARRAVGRPISRCFRSGGGALRSARGRRDRRAERARVACRCARTRRSERTPR